MMLTQFFSNENFNKDKQYFNISHKEKMFFNLKKNERDSLNKATENVKRSLIELEREKKY
ncbi:hypothetical protein P4571_06760 [Niallia alba]|uniref:hypothetical protein n=1 Tax=Niallia alba TaxID=2729105 RepID=UPI002E1FD3DF|nr:hypothetical protein [Niallia alba]